MMFIKLNQYSFISTISIIFNLNSLILYATLIQYKYNYTFIVKSFYLPPTFSITFTHISSSSGQMIVLYHNHLNGVPQPGCVETHW